MIRPLRRAHRAIFPLLLVVVGTLMIAGLRARREMPVTTPGPTCEGGVATATGATTGLVYRLLREADGYTLCTQAPTPLEAHAEWSVYVGAGETPESMRYVGSLDDRIALGPEPPARVLLYSVVEATTVETVTFPEATP